MRVPLKLELSMVEAIRRVAAADANLKNPQVEALMFTICRESYRAGVCAMQEPLTLWDEGPGLKEEEV